MMEICEMIPQRYGTRMTRIGRIFTDIHYPCVSASSTQSVFYRKTAIFDDDKKPQMKAPRVAPLEGASTSTVAPVDVAQPSRRLTPCTRMPAHWHTWTRPQGAQPLTYGSPPYVDIAGRYAPAGAYVSMHCGGHDADERRYFSASEYNKIIHRKGCKERKAHGMIFLGFEKPQRARRTQRIRTKLCALCVLRG